MGKRSSQNLFFLIKSLGKIEKRNFKVYAKYSAGENALLYLNLFDFIAKQDQAIESKETYESIGIKANQISNQKNYLYNQIIKSLQFFNANESPSIQIANLLFLIEFLYNKGLFKQCLKYLTKAKKLAQIHEKYLDLLKILQWERDLIQQEPLSDKTQKKLSDISDAENKTLEFHKNMIVFQNLSHKFNNLLHNRGLSNKDSENILNSIELSHPDQALSKRAKFFYFNIHAFYAYSKGNLEGTYEHFKNNVNLFRTTLESSEQNLISYIGVLNNFSSICSTLKKYDELLESIQLLKDIFNINGGKISEKIKISVFTRAFGQELVYYNNTGQINYVSSLLNKIEDGLNKYKGKIESRHEVMINYHLFLHHFYKKNYLEAQKWINEVLYKTSSGKFEELYSIGLIMNIINQYELDNIELLDNMINAAIKHFSNKKDEYNVVPIILRFMRKIGAESTMESTRKAAFIKVKEKIEELLSSKKRVALIRYFDIISWIESKIEKKDFITIVHQKHLNLSRKTKKSKKQSLA